MTLPRRAVALLLFAGVCKAWRLGIRTGHPPLGEHDSISYISPADVGMGVLAAPEARLLPARVRAPAPQMASVLAGPLLDERLVDALSRAVDDRRRVDEMVTLFSYDVRVSTDAGEWNGQGAAKRFFASMLLEGGYSSIAILEGIDGVSSDHTPCTTSIHVGLTNGAGDEHELIIRPHFGVDGYVSDIRIDQPEHHAANVPLVSPSKESADSLLAGPKWETFDGRVRQKIWQHADAFASGNTFLKDTCELTTGRVIMVVDQTVWDLYGEKMRAWADSVDLKVDAVVAPGNEDKKSMETFQFLLDELKRVDPLRRSEPVLAIGGGVLTDTVGFACACWRRGIPWVRMPTTLLGMVDASVGIKVAINYHRKNGVGHFFSPLHTVVDTSFLPTVTRADILSGVGEIMKAALIHDVRLYDTLREHGVRLVDENFSNSKEAADVIKLSVDAMLECIGPDLWEEALLRPMDFGHSFSRTLEADERFQLRHGEAVAIDALMSSLIAEQKGLLPTEQADDMLNVYRTIGLPCSTEGITAETYRRARDEIVVHRDGLLRAPLPAGIGNCVYVDDISDEEIEAAFAKLEGFITKHPEVCWNPSKSFESFGSDFLESH